MRNWRVSAPSHGHGTRLPVAELVDIAHEAGTLALVDAVQVPGQLPMDVSEWGADIVAAAGHKWLLGLWGGGFLYVNREVADALQPSTVGYRGVETPMADPYEFASGARRFEVGIDRTADRIQELAGRLADAIPDERLYSPRNPESGLVTIDVDDPEAAVDRLSSEGIVVRALPMPDAIRASVHAVNSWFEVDQLLDVLESEWA